MSQMTATAAEARASFPKIADLVSRTHQPVTVLKNSKPWVTINPITEASPIKHINWSKHDVIDIDAQKGYALLPADWDDPEDDGLYDDLV